MELKHASAYLLYDVIFYVDMYEFTNGNSKPELRKFTLDVDNLKLCLGYGKLALRPLLDLTKEIEHNGEKFVPIDKIRKSMFFHNEVAICHIEEDYKLWSVREYELAIEWHFDIFGLIESGQAIDINTLNK